MAFADKVRELCPGLVTGGEGMPEVAEVDRTSISAPRAFQLLPWATWPEAYLIPALKYLRGNKHLRGPHDWLMVFPKPFEILHKLDQRRHAEVGHNSEG